MNRSLRQGMDSEPAASFVGGDRPRIVILLTPRRATAEARRAFHEIFYHH